MALLSRRGQPQMDLGKDPAAGVAGTGQKDLQDSMRSVFSSSYLRAIAAVICISSFATTLTGWQFKALAKQSSVGKDALAIFFGDFYFYAGLLALLFQLLLTTRLLRRFGIGPMLFVLPIVVLAGSAGLLVLGTVGAALFLKGGDQVLRYSIYRSTADFLASNILASGPEEILYALRLFQVAPQRAAHPVIRGLLSHPAPEVRQKAISVLSAVGDKSVLPSTQLLLKDPDHSVRTEAMLYLVYHAHVDPLTLVAELGDCADFSIRSAVAAYLARPGE